MTIFRANLDYTADIDNFYMRTARRISLQSNQNFNEQHICALDAHNKFHERFSIIFIFLFNMVQMSKII